MLKEFTNCPFHQCLLCNHINYYDVVDLRYMKNFALKSEHHVNLRCSTQILIYYSLKHVGQLPES